MSAPRPKSGRIQVAMSPNSDYNADGESVVDTTPHCNEAAAAAEIGARHSNALLRVQLAASEAKLEAYRQGYEDAKHATMRTMSMGSPGGGGGGGGGGLGGSMLSTEGGGVPKRVKKRHKYNPFCQCQRSADGRYTVRDSEIIGASAYIFFLGFAPLGWVFAALALSVQTVAIVVFWFGAQKANKNSEYTLNTDYVFGVPTCFPQEREDAVLYPEGVFPPPVFRGQNFSFQEEEGGDVFGAFCDYDDNTQLGLNLYVWYTGLVMLGVLFLPGIAKGTQLFFRGPARWFCAAANIVTPVATLVVAWFYLQAVARSPTDVLTAVFIITFINDFDESVYGVFESLFPLYVKEYIKRLDGANAVGPIKAKTPLHMPTHAM